MVPDYKDIFRSLPGLYLILDTDFTIVEVSESYLQATYTERDKITGRNIFEVFPDNPGLQDADGVSNLRASLEHVLKYKHPHSMPVQRYDVRDASQSENFVRKYWSPYNLPVMQGEKVTWIIHKVEDVTAYVDLQEKDRQHLLEKTALRSNVDHMQREIIKRSEEIENSNRQLRLTLDKLTEKTAELERSNNELSNFAMTASHDIKAPFRIVGRYLEAIEDRLAPEDKQNVQEFFDRIYVARERIATLLDDLLDFAMVSTSDQLHGKVSIEQVIGDAVANLEVVISERGAVVKTPKELPVLDGERGPLVHLFQNLIGNALKFNNGIPVVKVDYRRQGKDHLFSVSDNGVGIEQEYFSRIFEVFQRLHRQDEFPGSGLGLSICKRVVERHGGTIWVESTPGKGTTFFFTLSETHGKAGKDVS